MGHQEHRKHATTHVGVAVVTVSDTRTAADDESGTLARTLVERAGHDVREHRILKDEPEAIRAAVGELASRPDVRAIIVNGGTGISPRDRTYEAMTSILERRLEGFGELFRAISYAEIGSAAMLSRASAGIIGDTVVFSVPGSTPAVRVALERLILPELGHIIAELDK